jgi:hypothetical protein
MKIYNRIIVTLIAIALLLMPFNSALAAPLMLCSGSGCNYVDPNTSGCAGDYRTYTAIARWKTAASGTVRMDLRYAPACYSNWTRVTNESPSAIRKLRAELWNSTQYVPYTPTTLITSYQSSAYVYIWTAMYNGIPINCGIGKQGPVGGVFDATTIPGCT